MQQQSLTCWLLRRLVFSLLALGCGRGRGQGGGGCHHPCCSLSLVDCLGGVRTLQAESGRQRAGGSRHCWQCLPPTLQARRVLAVLQLHRPQLVRHTRRGGRQLQLLSHPYLASPASRPPQPLAHLGAPWRGLHHALQLWDGVWPAQLLPVSQHLALDQGDANNDGHQGGAGSCRGGVCRVTALSRAAAGRQADACSSSAPRPTCSSDGNDEGAGTAHQSRRQSRLLCHQSRPSPTAQRRRQQHGTPGEQCNLATAGAGRQAGPAVM